MNREKRGRHEKTGRSRGTSASAPEAKRRSFIGRQRRIQDLAEAYRSVSREDERAAETLQREGHHRQAVYFLMQAMEKHKTDIPIHRQCALGILKLSGSNRAKEIFSATPQIINLWLTLMNGAMEEFIYRDSFIVWQFICCLKNLMKSHNNIKQMLFAHPALRSIYKNACLFVNAESNDAQLSRPVPQGEQDYTIEVLKQQVKDFIEIIKSEKSRTLVAVMTDPRKVKVRNKNR